jgi:phospholipid/cholesterol/gamma-HCH transport system substrate-binding protein
MARRRVVLAGIAGLAAAVALSGCGFSGLYSADLPGGADLGAHPYHVTVYFRDVLDLVPQSAVKVNDVAVGKVESIRLSAAKDGSQSGDPATNGWTARVTLQVNSDVKLPANARAEVKMTSLLGEKYVALQQPADQPATTELKNGSVIPLDHTGSAPEVEEVLGALSLLLNGGGLQQIRIITTELNKALKGNEGAVRDLLGQLNTFVGTLDRQKNDIVDALAALDRLSISLNEQKRTIVNALDTFPQALQILKDERGQLVTMLSSLANLGDVATRVITGTEQNFVSSLNSLTPVLHQLAAAGQNLPRAMKVALSFPFPVGKTTDMIRGDYANLHLYLDFNLTNELCGLNKKLCNLAPAGADGAAATPLSTDSSGASSLQPALIGVGG